MNTTNSSKKLIDLNFNISKNFCKIQLLKEINTLEESDIDVINNILFNEFDKLNNNIDIYLFLYSVFPVQVWVYIISLPAYIKANLYIYTKEDINQIKNYFSLPNNCQLIPMD